jgi:hypothetical protein
MSEANTVILHTITKSLVDKLNAVMVDIGELEPVGGTAEPIGDGGNEAAVADVFATVLDLENFELSDEALPEEDSELEVTLDEAIALVAQLLDGVMVRTGDCWEPISTKDATAIGLSPQELERANSAVAYLNGFDGIVQEVQIPVTMCRIDAVSYVATATVMPTAALGIIGLVWKLLKLLWKLWKYLRKSKNSVRRIRRAQQMRRAGTVTPAVARALILKEIGRLLLALEVLAEAAAGAKKAIDKLRAQGKNKEADAKQKELDKINDQIEEIRERLERLKRDEGVSDKEADKAKEEAKKEDAQGQK